MNIGVLGTGMVGQSLATKLAELRHSVTMGARSADNEAASQWAERAGENAHHGTFEDAAAFGEVVLECTAGAASLALEAGGSENLNGKVLMIDPDRVRGDHDLFVCGNDEEAKSEVRALLESFAWASESIHHLGDITAARATEGYLPLWIRLLGALGTADFNIRIAR